MKGPSRNPWPTSSKVSRTLGEVHPLNSLRHSTLGSKQCLSPPQRRLAEVRAGLESLGKFGGYECSPTNRMPCFTRSTTPVSGKPEDLRRDSHSTTLLGLEASATLGSSYCLRLASEVSISLARSRIMRTTFILDLASSTGLVVKLSKIPFP